MYAYDEGVGLTFLPHVQALMEAHAQRSMAAAERLRELTERRLGEEVGRLRERQAYEIKVRALRG